MYSCNTDSLSKMRFFMMQLPAAAAAAATGSAAARDSISTGQFAERCRFEPEFRHSGQLARRNQQPHRPQVRMISLALAADRSVVLQAPLRHCVLPKVHNTIEDLPSLSVTVVILKALASSFIHAVISLQADGSTAAEPGYVCTPSLAKFSVRCVQCISGVHRAGLPSRIPTQVSLSCALQLFRWRRSVQVRLELSYRT